MGVIGMNLEPGDEVVAMQHNTQGESLLIVTENGIGKRTSIDEFTNQHRGGKGVKCYKITDKTGYVVGTKAVNEDHEIMLITNKGTIIQICANDVSKLSRITSGVKLMNLSDNNEKIVSIAKVREKISNNEESDEENTGENIEEDKTEQ